MKRAGIRLLMVVVLVTTLLMGVVSSVQAEKPYIEINGGTFRLHDDDTDGSYQLYATATLHGQRVAHYAVEWFSNHSGAYASLGVRGFSLSTPTKTGTIALWGNDNLAPSFCGDGFYVKVYITNGKFNLNDHKSYTSPAVTSLACD